MPRVSRAGAHTRMIGLLLVRGRERPVSRVAHRPGMEGVGRPENRHGQHSQRGDIGDPPSASGQSEFTVVQPQPSERTDTSPADSAEEERLCYVCMVRALLPLAVPQCVFPTGSG